MTEQDKQALIEYYCQRDCGHTREECCLDNCYEIMLIEEFPITPTDTDTISRQAAIDEIDEWIKAFRESGHKQSAADARLIQDGIIKLSSAQPKRGKWHYSNGKPATIGRSFGVICDQCGTESEYCTNFCGECGADMRQGEQDG